VTFGIFQRPSKFSAEFWTCVGRILKQCPGSLLLVQYASNDLDEIGSDSRRRVHSALAGFDVAASRILFRGPVSRVANLEMLSSVDIALDTFPYNGQTTTCECLWMGVPVVTLAGNYHVARVGSSLLNQVGLPELVARNSDEYIQIACELASARSRLSELRTGLRDRLRASPLMDGRSVRDIEAAYQDVWERKAH
jgi:predicted O-linked N-acetylglucosamine transferase (SPINDLY family)